MTAADVWSFVIGLGIGVVVVIVMHPVIGLVGKLLAYYKNRPRKNAPDEERYLGV